MTTIQLRRITNIGSGPVSEKILRELGSNVRPIFTFTSPGLVWCELRLPSWRFHRTSVCSPGVTRDAALNHAISNAKRHMKASAA